MARRDTQALTEREELLLSRYFDGECGFLDRRRAERLLKASSPARSFLESLSAIGLECRTGAAAADTPDLWGRIEARIEAEERAALYLGERRAEAERPSWVERIRSQQAIFGGLTGAVVAAGVLLVASPPADLGAPGSTPPAASFKQAAVGGVEARPASFSPSSQSAMEVDWMRSNGSLKLIPNPSGKSATIWVRRRQGFPAGLRAATAAPLLYATPYRALDGERQDLSK